MEVSGNKQLLLKEVEGSFVNDFNDFEKIAMNEFIEEKKTLDSKQKKEMNIVMSEIERNKKRAYSYALAEEKLKARKEYENKREEIISRVFFIAAEKAKEELLKGAYLSQVKAFVNGKEIDEMKGGYEEYKNTFHLIGIDPNLNGIIVRKEGSIYDFTYKTFIASKKLEIRHKISNRLFENDI